MALSAYDLVLWIGGESAEDWRAWSTVADPVAFATERCHVFPSVVDDGVLDIHVCAESPADAERVKHMVGRHCRGSPGVSLESSLLLSSSGTALEEYRQESRHDP